MDVPVGLIEATDPGDVLRRNYHLVQKLEDLVQSMEKTKLDQKITTLQTFKKFNYKRSVQSSSSSSSPSEDESDGT